jgi:hypothetical protein
MRAHLTTQSHFSIKTQTFKIIHRPSLKLKPTNAYQLLFNASSPPPLFQQEKKRILRQKKKQATSTCRRSQSNRLSTDKHMNDDAKK